MRNSEQAIEQLWKDPDSKIQEFIDAFTQLRKDLDTGTIQHVAIVLSKVSEKVDILGMSASSESVSASS